MIFFTKTNYSSNKHENYVKYHFIYDLNFQGTFFAEKK